jgi:thiamine biosynthesis protein ThiI
VTDKLVLRPLIASHKQDIIDLANEIGTADFAKHMPEYCGVISVNPKTHAKRHRVEHEENSSTWRCWSVRSRTPNWSRSIV